MPEFVLFIDIERAKEKGKKLEQIVGPYDIWKDRELGAVFALPREKAKRAEIESSEGFRQYAEDPKYFKKEVFANY